ncbi:MAG TPA: dolichyl-phosphate beta-glucosyltransferase [Anaerolineae bacterium]|nr:dolichyl-phosphate beta-glucosyltransferase [Anaerolineae bacterium]
MSSTDSPPPSLTIVLPAYNEAARIEAALDELFGWLYRGGPARSHGRSSDEIGTWQVLVVDDGSEDDTVDVVEARPEARPRADGSGPALRLLRRRHAGKGAAVTAGVLAADGDLIVFTDADMATPPDQIPLLTEALATDDLALGSRIQPDGSDRRASQPAYRRLLGRIYRLLAGLWVTADVPDTQCGFKGFRRAAGHDIFGRLKTEGIAFDAEVIYLARRLGYSYAVVPVMWHDIHGSRMRVRPRLAFSVLWDLLRIPVIHRDVAGTMREPRPGDTP